jgi:hypothetical protein
MDLRQLKAKLAELKAAEKPVSKPQNAPGPPFGLIGAAVTGWYLAKHWNQLGNTGGFIIIIGAIMLGVMSSSLLADTMGRKLKSTSPDHRPVTIDEKSGLNTGAASESLDPETNGKRAAKSKTQRQRSGYAAWTFLVAAVVMIPTLATTGENPGIVSRLVFVLFSVIVLWIIVESTLLAFLLCISKTTAIWVFLGGLFTFGIVSVITILVLREKYIIWDEGVFSRSGASSRFFTSQEMEKRLMQYRSRRQRAGNAAWTLIGAWVIMLVTEIVFGTNHIGFTRIVVFAGYLILAWTIIESILLVLTLTIGDGLAVFAFIGGLLTFGLASLITIFMLRNKELKALVMEGVAASEAHHWVKALACFDRALALNGEYRDAWFHRGWPLGCQQRISDAIASLERAQRLGHRETAKQLVYWRAKMQI